MSQPLVLYNYRYSVYCWIVWITLAEKRLSYSVSETNPFAEDHGHTRFERTPFGLVPVLEHDAFTVYETAAICRYIDLSFPDPCLGSSKANGSRADGAGNQYYRHLWLPAYDPSGFCTPGFSPH